MDCTITAWRRIRLLEKDTQIKNMMKLLWTNNSSGYHSYDGIILTDLYKCMKTHFIAQVVVPDHVVTLVMKQ